MLINENPLNKSVQNLFVFFIPRLKIVFEYYLWSSLRSLLAWPGARNLSTYSHVNYAKLWRIYATLVRIVLHLFFSLSLSCFFLCALLLIWFFHSLSAGVNMGYMENNYSNSNNGGSVNSQDSLWQVKMSAAAVGNQQTLVQAPHNQYVEQQPTYGYDPLTHGGYGAVDDYAPYPHLTATPSQVGDEYHNLRNSQNPSRQDYCSDPYASVQKPKKRVDQHLGE